MPFYHLEDEDFDHADAEAPELVPRAVVAVGGALVTKGIEMPVHAHRKAQLVLTLRGVVRCEVDHSVWIVPPRCAVWIPGTLAHSVTVAGDVELYILFVEPDAAPALPRTCSTSSISPLLEHLKPGAIIVGENAFQPASGYIDYVRDPRNGYLSLPLSFEPGRGNEYTIKTK